MTKDLRKKSSALALLAQSNVEERITGKQNKPIELEPEALKKETIPEEKIERQKKTPMKRKTGSEEKALFPFSISPDVHRLLKLHSSFTGIPMSKTVEELLVKFFKNNKEFKDKLKEFMDQ